MSKSLVATTLCACLAVACTQSPGNSTAQSTSPPGPEPSPGAVAQNVEWPHYGGNLAAQRYSPLAQIDRSNVAELEVAWRFSTGNYGPRPEQRNETTPLMVNGVLYTTVGVTRNVVAIDPKTGETLWVWRPNDPEERYKVAPRKTRRLL